MQGWRLYHLKAGRREEEPFRGWAKSSSAPKGPGRGCRGHGAGVGLSGACSRALAGGAMRGAVGRRLSVPPSEAHLSPCGSLGISHAGGQQASVAGEAQSTGTSRSPGRWVPGWATRTNRRRYPSPGPDSQRPALAPSWLLDWVPRLPPRLQVTVGGGEVGRSYGWPEGAPACVPGHLHGEGGDGAGGRAACQAACSCLSLSFPLPVCL